MVLVASTEVAWLFAFAVKPSTVAPVTGLIEAILRFVTPLTVLNVPTMKSLVPSGEASTSCTRPPPKVGPEVRVDQAGVMLNENRDGLVVGRGVGSSVLDAREGAGDEDPVADVLEVGDVTGRDQRRVGPRDVVSDPGVSGHRLAAGGGVEATVIEAEVGLKGPTLFAASTA